MANVRVLEVFKSLQGEGIYVGVPSIFIRFFGCNFRCRKFGRSADEVIDGPNPEVAEIIKNIGQYKTLAELPLVKTGCDSYSSIYPEFKHFAKDYTVDELVKEINEHVPDETLRKQHHIILTGGEPMLRQKLFPTLFEHADMQNSYNNVTIETNGTQPISKEFGEFVRYNHNIKFTFSVSAKLSNSGEPREKAIQPHVVSDYCIYGKTYLKFVVTDESHVREALETIEVYRKAGFNGPVYLMPEGGTTDTNVLTAPTVAKLALQYGLRYSPRIQVDLFKNEWGT